MIHPNTAALSFSTLAVQFNHPARWRRVHSDWQATVDLDLSDPKLGIDCIGGSRCTWLFWLQGKQATSARFRLITIWLALANTASICTRVSIGITSNAKW